MVADIWALRLEVPDFVSLLYETAGGVSLLPDLVDSRWVVVGLAVAHQVGTSKAWLIGPLRSWDTSNWAFDDDPIILPPYRGAIPDPEKRIAASVMKRLRAMYKSHFLRVPVDLGGSPVGPKRATVAVLDRMEEP